MVTKKQPGKKKSARKPVKKATATKPTAGKKRATKKKAATKSISSDAAKREGKKYEKKAEQYAKDPKKLKELVKDASREAGKVNRGPFKETWAYLMAMIRIVKAYANGSYKEIPWQSLIMIIAAVLYFVSPVDLIPDFIPGGLLDDALVVALALRTVQGDLDDFLEWELTQA